MTGSPTHEALPARRSPPGTGTLILIAGLSALNMSIILPSLAAMTIHFGTSYGIMQFAVSAYLAATAVLQLLIGPISDRVGRRPVLLVAILLFIVFALAAAAAESVEMFLFFRMCQAVIVTCMVLSRAIVRDLYSSDESASMIGYVTMGMALVPMLGPMFGGILQESFGWQSIQIGMAVAGAAVFAVVWRDLGETLPATPKGSGGQMRGLAELLRARRFWGYVACSAAASGAFFALLGGASFVSDTVFGLTPRQAGLALGSPALGYAFGNFLSGRFTVRFGINRMALAGTIIATVCTGMSLALALMGYESVVLFFGMCTLLGVGNGLTMPNSVAGSLSVRPELAGTASGLGGAIMIAGGAAVSGISGTFLTAETGAIPLHVMMFACSGLSAVAILYVIARAQRVGAG